MLSCALAAVEPHDSEASDDDLGGSRDGEESEGVLEADDEKKEDEEEERQEVVAEVESEGEGGKQQEETDEEVEKGEEKKRENGFGAEHGVRECGPAACKVALEAVMVLVSRLVLLSLMRRLSGGGFAFGTDDQTHPSLVVLCGSHY